MSKRILIFIPAFKAEKTVCSVINRIPSNIMQKTEEIAVFDNHSPDQTSRVVEEYKKEKNFSKLTVHRNTRNLFFGGNLKAGFDYAIEKDMDILVMLHSDGQYPPEKIGELINPIEKGEAHTTFGSRFLGNPIKGGMPLWRFLGNILLTQVENLLVGIRFSEWHSGFCAYDLKILRKLPYQECENGYELTTDILLLFITNNLKIKEISIPTHYGKESTSPSIKRTFTYFINSFTLAFYYFLHKKKLKSIKKYKRII